MTVRTMEPSEGGARERLLDTVLAEALGGRRPPDVRTRVLAALAGVTDETRAQSRPAPRLLAAALVLLGGAAVFAVALHPRSTPTAGQEPTDRQQVLDELRSDIQRQERAAAVLAWTAWSRTTIGTGDQQRSSGELRARIVLETKPTGRIHAWFEPQRNPWQDHDQLGTETGEAVHARINAMLMRTWAAGESASVAINQGWAGGNDHAADLADRAGASTTLWRSHIGIGGRVERFSGVLRGVRAADVQVGDGEVVVQDRNHQYRFRRHDRQFSLLEHRYTIGAKVFSNQVVEESCVDGKLWFPRRIRMESWWMDEPSVTEVDISEVRLDPPLAAGTFTIVAPAVTRFAWPAPDGKSANPLPLLAPELEGVVRYESASVPRPEPPTAPYPTGH